MGSKPEDQNGKGEERRGPWRAIFGALVTMLGAGGGGAAIIQYLAKEECAEQRGDLTEQVVELQQSIGELNARILPLEEALRKSDELLQKTTSMIDTDASKQRSEEEGRADEESPSSTTPGLSRPRGTLAEGRTSSVDRADLAKRLGERVTLNKLLLRSRPAQTTGAASQSE